MKKSEIKFTITLDDQHLPETIEWEAGDSGVEGAQKTKAVMLSLWDADENNTLRIDLWTKDMLVDEMKVFFHQTLLSMGDTLVRSTNEEELAAEVKKFGKLFAEKAGLNK